jgi:hypothetical protein
MYVFILTSFTGQSPGKMVGVCYIIIYAVVCWQGAKDITSVTPLYLVCHMILLIDFFVAA